MAKKKNEYDFARNFAMVDHVMTRDKRFRELDWWCRSVLMYLYITPNGRNGLVRESMDEIAEYTGMTRKEIKGILADLEEAGRIHRDGMDILLIDWREWQGGRQHKDPDGRMKITKTVVRKVQLERQTLGDDLFQRYVETCDFASSDAMFGVLERKEKERGGDRKSAKFKSQESKRNQNEIKTGSKQDQNRIDDRDIDGDVDRDGKVNQDQKPIKEEQDSTAPSPSLKKTTTAFATMFGKTFKNDKDFMPKKGSKQHTQLLELTKWARKLYKEIVASNFQTEEGFSVRDAIGMLLCAGVAYEQARLKDRDLHLGNLASGKFKDFWSDWKKENASDRTAFMFDTFRKPWERRERTR